MSATYSRPLLDLHEDSCCRCLRGAWEVAPDECDAIFEENGDMIKKCHHCAVARKDCVAVGFLLHFFFLKKRFFARDMCIECT